MKDIFSTSDAKFRQSVLFYFAVPRDQEQAVRVKTLTEIEKTD
jgi:hypothetical protein